MPMGDIMILKMANPFLFLSLYHQKFDYFFRGLHTVEPKVLITSIWMGAQASCLHISGGLKDRPFYFKEMSDFDDTLVGTYKIWKVLQSLVGTLHYITCLYNCVLCSLK
jgi:hypothetical protein